MIRQILLFKWKTGTTTTDISILIKEWKKLEQLDSLISVEIGKNISQEGYDQGF